MKKILSGIVLSFLLLPGIAGAETGVRVSTEAKVRANATGTSTEARLKAKAELDLRKKEIEERREELKDEMEERREAIKQEIEQRREDLKDEIKERKDNALSKIQERLVKFTENITERFDAAIERLDKLAQRIDSRIAKMESQNIDVKEAKDLMVVAKLKIETAKTSITGISLESGVVASSSATSTTAFKEDFASLKIQVEKAKADVKAAHAALVNVINSLKPGLNKKATTTPSGTATTTATSTATTTVN